MFTARTFIDIIKSPASLFFIMCFIVLAILGLLIMQKSPSDSSYDPGNDIPVATEYKSQQFDEEVKNDIKELAKEKRYYLLTKADGKRVDNTLYTRKELRDKVYEIMKNEHMDEAAMNETFDYEEVDE